MAKEMRIDRHQQYIDSVYTYSVDLSVLDQTLGVTSSTVTWSTEDSGVVSIGTAAFSSNIATAPITANGSGEALIKLTIATDGDDAPVYFFSIMVLDPENETRRIAYR